MKPEFKPEGIKKTKPSEYLVRFLYGGFVCSCTGLATKAFGPVVGGFLLSFPAILPATLTLVKEHDGRRIAVEDARGARLGSIGLMAFAIAIWLTATSTSAAIALGSALLAWCAANGLAWVVSASSDGPMTDPEVSRP